MASLISGFEYDIFISYRQKDNKGDRWVSEFVSHLKTDVKKPRFQAYLALAYNKCGDQPSAEKIIAQLKLMSKVTTANSPEYFVGWYYMGSEQADSAFVWLQKALGNRSTQLTWLNADPVFKKVVYDERYRSLYDRTGHSGYQQFKSSTDLLKKD